MASNAESKAGKKKGKNVEGLEEMSSCEENSDEGFNFDEESDDSESMADEEELSCEGNDNEGFKFDEDTVVNSEEDLVKVNLTELTSPEYIVRFHFPDLDVAFMFYNWYGSIKGFSARKGKLLRNSRGEVTQQTFDCHKEGQRRQKHYNREGRVQKPKPDTRCGCLAKCQVHVDEIAGRWYIKYLNDSHNHTLVLDKWTGMLPGHRKMNEHDKYQMNIMRSVGIGPSNIYGLFAAKTGGFDKVGFMKRDMYNQQSKQKRFQTTDATAVVEFLDCLSKKDNMFYWKHIVTEEGRLEQMFWCDGACREHQNGDVRPIPAQPRVKTSLLPNPLYLGITCVIAEY